MNNIIHEIAVEIISSLEEGIEKLLEEGSDISEFILSTETTLNEIGVKLVGEALETLDKIYRKSRKRKAEWTIKSKADEKTLATIFGEVKYRRSYYVNKKTGEYSYLSDESVGISSHDKLDTSLKAGLIRESVDMSYSKSGSKVSNALTLTGQTVMNSIRELGKIPNNAVAIKEGNKKVRVIYIEGDEEHAASQTGGIIEPNLVYVHEGREKIGKDRYRLKNVRSFSGVYANSDELWLEVVDCLYEAYDMDSVEKIYLSGDGAAWIKNGLGWIKGSIYVLDRYHLTRYVTQATGHMKHTTSVMWHYINQGYRDSVKELFKVILEETDAETKRKSVREARGYILNNWEAIMRYKDSDYIGCSAEGHVSHLLSDRLSSRPLGWSEIGADQMSRLRVFVANGGNIYDYLMEKKKRDLKETRRVKLEEEIHKRRKYGTSYETIGNLTILNIGKRTQISEYLRAVRDN